MNKCAIAECDSPVRYKGLCGKHYKRQWRHGDPRHTELNMTGERGICSAPLCEAPVRYPATGLCHSHHLRFTRYGRFHRIRALDGSGYTDTNGYRVVTLPTGIKQYEHILIAEKALGKPLPKGAIVHHVNGQKADNRPENLVICPDQAYHLLLHRLDNERKAREFLTEFMEAS